MRMKLAAAAVCLAFGGCGGGGSSDPASAQPPPPTPSAAYNLDAAVTNVFTKGAALGPMQGQVNGATYALTLKFTPAADDTVFVNAPVYHTVTEVATLSGPTITSSGQIIYFSTAPVRIAYVTSGNPTNDFTSYTVVAPLPTTATVGQGGTWSHATLYRDSAQTSAVGQQTADWSLEPDAGATAWACLTFTVTGALANVEKDCYRIDQAGNVSGAKATVTVNGQAVTFQ